MFKTGSIDLPLHYGRAPFWLLERMKKLAAKISELMVIEKGRAYFLNRLSDPLWFQCFGCVLGFDWHSSGLTTTVCGVLKEVFKDLNEYGVFICGGKGATSRKTPQEIESIANSQCEDLRDFIKISRLVAKVDNNALQDGFNLYHHTFIFTKDKRWVVIQQGMSEGKWARRYHWNGEGLASFVRDPHKAIVSDKSYLTLNMVDIDKDDLRDCVVELACRKERFNMKDLISLQKEVSRLPFRHRVLVSDINPKYLYKTFLKSYKEKPSDFESLLALEGVGAKTIRALALISDLIYGKKVSFRDPARFSFAHGGKDGYPYRIKISDYEKTIEVLNNILNRVKINNTEKQSALRRLYKFYNSNKPLVESGK